LLHEANGNAMLDICGGYAGAINLPLVEDDCLM